MKQPPISADAAKVVIIAALKRGPVHMFNDEADDTSRIIIRALLAHWPKLFKEE